MFELSQLRFFIAVATELNFSRAAKRLNMTQPPLSRQIQLLEHQLGVELFERSTRSVKLTVAGLAFYKQANQLLEHATYAAQQAKRIAAGETGNLTLSFVSCAIYALIPAVIHRIRHKYPQLNINLFEQSTAEQLSGLQLQKNDVGIIRTSIVDDNLYTEKLLSEPFVLAIPSHHPLAKKNLITIKQLEKQKVIIYSSMSWQPFYEKISTLFYQENVQPDYELCTGSTATILSMVKGGLGLALVPAGGMHIRFSGVVYKELVLATPLISDLYLARRKDNINPAIETLINALKECAISAEKADFTL
ncbi:LysR family transcriptional regulator [Martelella alba]|uniref:LysR family transcriptional regulator n=1 Tax=Martelella alba TaxID=2590451 RepID=A0ABY2SE59_9HYPH|nr:LysR substrate-binding domain-containing protein [Martelella alba]TKI03005.1 LysR family transcriptional regulator [Martelella alba]